MAVIVETTDWPGVCPICGRFEILLRIVGRSQWLCEDCLEGMYMRKGRK